MSRFRRGGVFAAVLLVVLSLAAVAFAATITPKNGTFKGSTPKYTARGHSETGAVTLTVKRHKISAAQLTAQILPVDSATSKNSSICDANTITTSGMKRSGKIQPTGAFSYKWVQGTSWVTLTGQFVSPKKVVGKIRGYYAIPAIHVVCDTGKVKFTAKHSYPAQLHLAPDSGRDPEPSAPGRS